MRKECLITTGATAQFPALIRGALTQDCLQAFSEAGFTNITFQCGDSLSSFQDWKPDDIKGLELRAFGFNREGLNKEMRACQAQQGVSETGLVICHAGAGTILDAMRLGLRLVVVPNVSLLDNHQEELAEELEIQGYAIRADVENLALAVRRSCTKENKAWGANTASISKIIDEVVGYEEDVKARLD